MELHGHRLRERKRRVVEEVTLAGHFQVRCAGPGMVVLGLLADGADAAALHVGMDVELELGPLYEDDEHEYVVWKWKPTEASRA